MSNKNYSDSFKNRQSAEILRSVYRNAEMAYEASTDVLKHCRNAHLYSEISAQRDRYRQVAGKMRSELNSRGEKAPQYSPYAKAMTKMGIAMKTMSDDSSSGLAALMLRGTTMGIIDMQHAVNRSAAAEQSIRSDAQELLAREQSFCDSLKRYL